MDSISRIECFEHRMPDSKSFPNQLVVRNPLIHIWLTLRIYCLKLQHLWKLTSWIATYSPAEVSIGLQKLWKLISSSSIYFVTTILSSIYVFWLMTLRPRHNLWAYERCWLPNYHSPLLSLFDRIVPIRTCRVVHTSCPWISSEIWRAKTFRGSLDPGDESLGLEHVTVFL